MENDKKFVLQFTLPSGQKLVASEFLGKLALVPVGENSFDGTFLVWNSPQEVSAFMKDLKESAAPGDFEKIWKLRPTIVVVVPKN